MMKMRQQQQLKGTSINMNKQNALLHLHKRPIGKGEFVRDGFISMATFGVNEYERDESPVSVISHSATIVSQPSSACTSMEHQFNHLISNPNSNHRQRIAINPNHECPFSQSMGTSAASTSEDDSSANYDISTMFIAVPPKQEDLSQQAQEHAFYSKGIVRKSSTAQLSKRVAFTHQTCAKALNRSSSYAEADRVTDSYNSDDDDQMISIDFQGLQEDPMVLRESYGNKLTVKDQKHAVGATLKHYGEWKEEDINLNRSTSNAHKEFIVARPITNSSATKVVNHANSNPRKEAPLNAGKHEEEPPKGRLKLAKPSNAIPSLISRQRSINSAKLGVPSKWDDAEKWLCYDNHQLSHFNKVKSSSTSRPTLHSIPSSGGKMFGVNKELKCIDVCASPNRGGLNVKEKAFECRSGQSSVPSRGKLNVSNARECQDYMAHGVVADRSMLQSTNLTSCRMDHSSADANSRGNHARASQSSSSNEVVENVMLAYGYLDTLKRKWNEVPQVKPACQKDVSDYTTSGEITNPHLSALNRKLAAISVSDGEINPQITCRIASRMSASTGSMPGEVKAKEGIRPASNRNWIRSKSDALVTPCKCDYSSSGGDTMSRANQQNVAIGICASDGELCENDASDQQFKSKGSYTQRFMQHQILQKLRRKCSPRKGAYAIATSGKAVEEVGRHTARVNSCLQNEFVVQTPTNGRSASMKDACTEVSPSLSRRDIGTQMTPPSSSPITPKCTTPLQNTSPARHNTPTRASPTSNRERNDMNTFRSDDDGMSRSAHRISRCDNGSALELESCHWAKLELREPPSGAQTSGKISDLGSMCNDWSPGYGLEEEIVDSKDGGEEGQCAQDEVNSGAIMVSRAGALEARAAAWEDAERAKFNAKFKREEARIKAWEDLQKAKAEADLKKLEVKLERLRSKATEKVLNRVAATEKRAEEMRAAAEAQQAEQMKKMREKACNLRKSALFPGSFAVCFARNYMP